MTTSREVSLIFIRVLTAYMLLQAVSILPMSISYGGIDSEAFFLSHEITMFVLAVILWVAAPPLSKAMVSGTESVPETEGANAHYQVEALIISAIGLVMVVVSVPALANMVAYNSAIDTMSLDATTGYQMIASSKGFTAKYLVRIVIGLFLIFYSRKLCLLVEKIRNKLD